MNCLLIGGAGFIGSRLARALASRGHAVAILDALDPQIHGQDLAASSTLSFVRGHATVTAGDARDSRVLRPALDQAEVVYLLAAGTGTGQSMYQVRHYADVNVGSAAQLAQELAARRGAVQRVVVSSSRAVYGEGAYTCSRHGRVHPESRAVADMDAGRFEPVCPECGGPLATAPSREDDPARPTSVYGITKYAQEQLILNVCGALGIPAVALRYQNVYGPGQSLKNPYTGILAIFSQLILQGQELNLFEDALATRDFVFIDDVVEYSVRAGLNPVRGTPVLNVGTGARQTLLDVASTLGAALGRPVRHRVSGQYRVGDIRHAAADTSRLVAALGAHAFTDFATGVRRFTEWTTGEGLETEAVARYRQSLDEMQAKGLFRGAGAS